MPELIQLKDDPRYPLAANEEINLKQVYAYLFQACGYKLNIEFKKIHDKKNFVSSDVDDESGFEELPLKELSGTDKTISQFMEYQVLERFVKDTGYELPESTVSEATVDALLPKEHHHIFKHHNVKEVMMSMISGARNDTFDTPLLRYIVARKHHVDGAVEMCVKCLDWRINSHPVDEWFRDGDAKVFFEGKHPKLIDAFRINQAYLRGADKNGQPIIRVAVKKHFRHNCPDADFEKFICMVIEYVRLCLADTKGVNKGVILFDMSGFSLSNADLHAIKFLISSFEANYPEYLGHVLIHSAPWIFNSVWVIIKPLLDPVVASKIAFTKKAADLEKYIDPKYIPKELGGQDDYEPEYVEPTKENSGRLPVDDKFEKLLKERFRLVSCFVQSTISWIEATSKSDSYNLLVQRIKLQKDLSLNYIALDPYTRYKSPFERNGQITDIKY